MLSLETTVCVDFRLYLGNKLVEILTGVWGSGCRRIQGSAKEMWDRLKLIYEGTSEVKEPKPMVATWSASDQSSSEAEEPKKEECGLMAIEDESPKNSLSAPTGDRSVDPILV
ncbi:hypothetical protein Taro_025292 [Colocasia esculenta]|uniref:Uncharacterized protein n=1 Tax=Colocasia esculenta TaxID=4460 RepID=A0A843VK32_COLES|nr:hypothetical protein [Colocasia esculenta]